MRVIDRDGRVSPAFIALYALAYTATWLALLTPVIVTLALRIRELDPAHAAESVSLTLSIGALFALVSNPLFGALSDRTTSRWGRRRPWLAGGAFCAALSLAVIAYAPNVALIIAGWCCAQLAFNAVLAALVAILPDQVPTAQRGTVAGVLGICMPIGQIAGAFLVQALTLQNAILLPAALALAALWALTAVLPDQPHNPTEKRPANFFLSALRTRDFAWAWLSRLLFVMGGAFLTAYQALYLIDKLGIEVKNVPTIIFHSTLVYSSAMTLFSLIGGRLSDTLQRRKRFVAAGAGVFAAGLCCIAVADTYASFLFGIAISGIGHGVYVGVDLALVSEVLPDEHRHAAKDLGILNITNTLPQVVVPAISPAILHLSQGDYTALFLFAAAFGVLALFTILPLQTRR
jgi:MFS family permease